MFDIYLITKMFAQIKIALVDNFGVIL